MIYKLGTTELTLHDLDETSHYYDSQSPGLGADFRREIDLIFDSLLHMPKMYASGFRGVRKGYRGRFPYVVYYRLIGEEISVFAVLHASRHSSAWTSRLPKPDSFIKPEM